MKKLLAFLCSSALSAAFASEETDLKPATGADQSRGQEIIRKFAEVNRYWLLGPPPAVRQFSYTLHRPGKEQEFAVPDPIESAAPAAIRG